MLNARTKLVTAFILASSAITLWSQQPLRAQRFNAINPLGSENLLLRPRKQQFSILASLESPQLAQWQLITTPDEKKYVRGVDGKEVKYYPGELDFRVTAGTRTRLAMSPLDYRTDLSAVDLPAALHFRLKIFHGMDVRTLEPVSARIIGVPTDTPYPERIFRITFQLPKVPVEDRMSLEILDDKGERVTKFGFQLL
jgi:hypothetical protein